MCSYTQLHTHNYIYTQFSYIHLHTLKYTQEVNLVTRLQRYGMTAQAAFALLDAAPRLRFSVHVGAHTGCRAEYSVTVCIQGCCLLCIDKGVVV